MLESYPVAVAVGTVLGFLSGLGTGGGSLLLLYLTLLLGMEGATARSINLMFYIPAAVIACLFRKKQGALDQKKVLPAIVAGCVSAGIFSMLGRLWDTELLKQLFGTLLLFIGVKELFYRPRKAK